MHNLIFYTNRCCGRTWWCRIVVDDGGHVLVRKATTTTALQTSTKSSEGNDDGDWRGCSEGDRDGAAAREFRTALQRGPRRRCSEGDRDGDAATEFGTALQQGQRLGHCSARSMMAPAQEQESDVLRERTRRRGHHNNFNSSTFSNQCFIK